jgi:hypothetical protein
MQTPNTSKRLRPFGMLAIAVAIVFATASCFATGPQVYRFVVAIDTIVVADSIGPNDVLPVNLRGVIAVDGCAQFVELQKTRSGGTVDYTAIAEHDDRRICVPMLILFNRVDSLSPPHTNPTTIRALQPNGGSPVTRTVLVK